MAIALEKATIAVVARLKKQCMMMAVRFPIDFDHCGVSMVAVMRAPLCVVNERRQQQVAGLSQAHLPVQPERAVFRRVRVATRG